MNEADRHACILQIVSSQTFIHTSEQNLLSLLVCIDSVDE